jgi:hypothetical protein
VYSASNIRAFNFQNLWTAATSSILRTSSGYH